MTGPTVVLEDWIDRRPSSLHRVLAGKECSVADKSVAQQSLIRRLFTRVFIGQVELSLLANKFLARPLDTSGERNGGAGRNPETKIVGPPRRGS
jgi:hypothetical protein